MTRLSLKTLSIGARILLPSVLSVALLSCSRDGDSSSRAPAGSMTPFIDVEPFSAITNGEPFQAKVLTKIIRKRDDGTNMLALVTLQVLGKTNFSIGHSQATPIEVEFLSTLEVGREYLFPAAFWEWEKKR